MHELAVNANDAHEVCSLGRTSALPPPGRQAMTPTLSPCCPATSGTANPRVADFFGRSGEGGGGAPPARLPLSDALADGLELAADEVELGQQLLDLIADLADRVADLPALRAAFGGNLAP